MANTANVIPTVTAVVANTTVPQKVAQAFLVDAALVANVAEVMLTRVDLYCRSKPAPVGPTSGIQNPGVSVYMIPTTNSVPDPAVLNNLSDYEQARLEYSDITSSLDASVASSFRFSNPVPATTGQYYCFVIDPDGGELYQWWGNTKGELVVGQANNVTSGGVSGEFVGAYYELTATDISAFLTSWKPLTTRDLTFTVYCARYGVGGVPFNANTANYQFAINRHEFLTYNVAGWNGVRLTPGEYCVGFPN